MEVAIGNTWQRGMRFISFSFKRRNVEKEITKA